MYTTLFTSPQRKKPRGLGWTILLAMQQVPLSLSISPCRLCSDCSYMYVVERWSAIMLEPYFSVYCKGYLLHGQRKHVLEEFQVSCTIQTVWNDGRSQQIISKNSTPDVYVESLLVISDEHCVRILIVPDVVVSTVEVATSCEEGLISKQELCRKGRIRDSP